MSGATSSGFFPPILQKRPGLSIWGKTCENHTLGKTFILTKEVKNLKNITNKQTFCS